MIKSNAKPRARQFLVEAVVLCLPRGAVGILIRRGGSLVIRHVAGWPTEPSLLALAGSGSITTTVGVIFGYSFFWKTSRLSPIEGLCYE